MGRAILRSKIFAKQNTNGPGGGSGGTGVAVWGSFWHTANQNAAAINTPYPTKFNNADVNNNGVTISNDPSGNPTIITVPNTGIYNIQFSIQFKSSDVSIHNAKVWLRINDTGTAGDVPDTTGELAITAKHGVADGLDLPAWNYVLKLNAGDYIQLMWMVDNTNISMAYLAAGANYPASPSSILTVTEVTGIVSGGGGGGSAIAVYNEGVLLTSNALSFNFTGNIIEATNTAGAITVNSTIPNILITAADLLTQQSLAQLITGAWYRISDKPANWTIFVNAISDSLLDPKGVAFYTGRPEAMDCWYDLTANNPIKIYDPKYNNIVGGWITIEKFKWNNSNWNNNYIGENSIVYIDGTTNIPYFTNNFIAGGSSVSLVGTVITTSFSYNTISSSNFDLTNNALLNDVSYNTIFASLVIASDTGAGSFDHNVIESSNLELYNGSKLNHCNIFGMGFKSGNAIIDTGSAFEGCEYNLNETSTFYADYDLDDPAIYDGISQLTLPFGHNQWVGEARVGGVANPTYLITDILNFPAYNHLYIYNNQAGSCLVELRDTTAFFKFYSGVVAPDLTYSEDYALLTGITPKIGPATGTNMVLLDYKKY